MEDQKNIFSPFEQASEGIKIGGTGLGLAISAKQIKFLEGHIELKSEQGYGSIFSFSVKLSPGKAQSVANNAHAHEIYEHLAENTKLHALVVDDVVDNRDVLRQVLAKVGITVETAVNGKDAFEKCKNKT